MNQGKSETRLGWTAIVLAAFWGCLVLYAMNAALPESAIRLPWEDAISARSFLPEGWGFFTRDPREPDVVPMKHVPGQGWVPAIQGSNVDPAYAFGFSRSHRGAFVELGQLVTGLSKQGDLKWTPCTDRPPAACLADARAASVLDSYAGPRTLCGSIGLVEVEAVPWAWAHSVGSRNIVKRALRLTVTC